MKKKKPSKPKASPRQSPSPNKPSASLSLTQEENSSPTTIDPVSPPTAVDDATALGVEVLDPGTESITGSAARKKLFPEASGALGSTEAAAAPVPSETVTEDATHAGHAVATSVNCPVEPATAAGHHVPTLPSIPETLELDAPVPAPPQEVKTIEPPSKQLSYLQRLELSRRQAKLAANMGDKVLGKKIKDIVRHKAKDWGIEITAEGWVWVDDVLAHINRGGKADYTEAAIRTEVSPRSLRAAHSHLPLCTPTQTPGGEQQ